MAITGVQMSVDDRILRGKLRAFNLFAKNQKAAWADIGQTLLTSIIKNFEVGGRPKWTKLDEKTIERKRKAKKNRVLQWSSDMKNSINSRPTEDGVTIGTSGIPYAAIHQYGGPCGVNHSVMMLKRPFIVIQPEDKKEMANIIDRHIERIFK